MIAPKTQRMIFNLFCPTVHGRIELALPEEKGGYNGSEGVQMSSILEEYPRDDPHSVNEKREGR